MMHELSLRYSKYGRDTSSWGWWVSQRSGQGKDGK
jgi:hypothetical protein